MTHQAVSVSHVRITAGRMVCDVDISPGFPRYATSELMSQVVRRYPALPHHACVNGCGVTFGCVMNDTSLPHVLEHMIIDIQVRRQKSLRGFLVGTTEWVDEAAGKAMVSVSFQDDLCALSALNEALDVLNELIVEQVRHL